MTPSLAVLDLLERGRAYLSRPNTWTQDTYMNGSGQVCAVGAIYAAAGWTKNYRLDQYQNQRTEDAISLLDAHAVKHEFMGIIVANDLAHSVEPILTIYDLAINQLRQQLGLSVAIPILAPDRMLPSGTPVESEPPVQVWTERDYPERAALHAPQLGQPMLAGATS